MGVPPHIRDALEQARLAAEEGAPLMVPPRFSKAAPVQQDTARLALEQTNGINGDPNPSRIITTTTSTRRESSLVSRLAGKEKQVRDMRAYVHDALHLQNKQHAYLRATHLDPAIGLEIKLLASAMQVQYSPPRMPPSNSDIEEVKAALATSEVVRDQLKRENCDLKTQLRQAEEWKQQLEQERDELYHSKDHGTRTADVNTKGNLRRAI